MITDKINSKLDEAKKLTRKLDKSIALEYLWPEAFDHGRARAHWFGKTPSTIHFKKGEPLHLHHEFHITDGDGNKKMFSYDDVPTILGGGLPDDQWSRITNLTVRS